VIVTVPAVNALGIVAVTMTLVGVIPVTYCGESVHPYVEMMSPMKYAAIVECVWAGAGEGPMLMSYVMSALEE
jgi:hypothetical protein